MTMRTVIAATVQVQGSVNGTTARDKSTRSIPSLSEADPPYLGYDLAQFGPHGLKWMKEYQARDPTFRNRQTVQEAEKRLGVSLQRLDHVRDCHFPTNLEKFGFVRISIDQRKDQELKAAIMSRHPCWDREKGRCAPCGDGVPAFMYAHPSLICANNGDNPTLLSRFAHRYGQYARSAEHNDDEVFILQCHNCWVGRTGRKCSFNNGSTRLRLLADGSVKILYKTPSVLEVARDIGLTNVGIEEDAVRKDKKRKKASRDEQQRTVAAHAKTSSRLRAADTNATGGHPVIVIDSSDESETESEHDEEEKFYPTLRYQNVRETLEVRPTSDQSEKKRPANHSSSGRVDKQRKSDRLGALSNAQKFHGAPIPAPTVKLSASSTSRPQLLPQVASRHPLSTSRPGKDTPAVRPSASTGSTSTNTLSDLDQMLADARAEDKKLDELAELKRVIAEKRRRLQQGEER